MSDHIEHECPTCRSYICSGCAPTPAESNPMTSDKTPTADSVQEDAARYRWLAGHCRSTSEHWGGRWSIVVDGPAPKSHDSEDDLDAAIDAARKQGQPHDPR